MNQRANQKVCFLAGAGHSGSTLLGLILGSHTECFYAGEAAKTRFLGNPNITERKRVCKLCGPDCAIWGDFVVSDTVDLYEQLSLRTGKPVIIDSTKNVAWLREQHERLRPTIATASLIFLMRDGRAVLNSRLRKYPDKSAQEAIADWMEQIAQTRALFDAFDGPKLALHYEELATAPADATRRVCAFLALPYQPDMIQFHRHEHHPLGGNTGTQSLVSKAHHQAGEQGYIPLSEHQEEYYVQHPLDIRLDMRWLHELDPDAKRLFDEMAGPTNEAFRWEE